MSTTSIAQHSEHTNRLAKEESPYLLQHAHNPVDWYPWGQEAFDKAVAEDIPIFLSVGYSTCHWCHVMERESFESEEVAAIMNAKFVNIKVDREERPDVDKVYMTYILATSGGGGWPMSVFLTPGLEPILGGTYFAPESAYGRPGFKTVLNRVSEAWHNQKQALLEQGAEVMKAIADAVGAEESERAGEFDAKAADGAIQQAYQQLSRSFDRQNGGFSTAPKFPRMSEVNLMLLQFKAAKQGSEAARALHMAEVTLQKMAAGGIYDHIGGGFARYSVDEKWHVPHFEKMLYDNPQIVQTYLDAFRATGNPEYAKVVRGALDYLLRDMTHPQGGFYSAEDADSLEHTGGEKKEGAFYVWTKQEIDTILGGADSEQAQLFDDFYNVRLQGNATLSPRSDPHGEFKGKNVLINLQPLTGDPAPKERLLADAREKLHAVRGKRPRPHLDDKIVTAWNGFAIGALAAASRALKSEDPPIERLFPVEGRDPAEYRQAAVQAAEFVERHLWSPETKRLCRSFCRGPSEVEAFDSDYAFLAAGLLDLYSVSGDTRWLAWARQLQDTLDQLFWDPKAGGYFTTTGADPSIKLRMKEDHDGAEPGASSVATANLLQFSALAAPEEAGRLRQRAAKTAAAFKDRLEQAPHALTQMCCSLSLLTAGHLRQVIIAGRKGAADTEALLDAAHAAYCPDKVVVLVDKEDATDMAFWQEHNPSVLEMAAGAKGDEATAFICQNFACRAPTTDPDKVKTLLSEPGTSGLEPSQASINLEPLDLGSLKNT